MGNAASAPVIAGELMAPVIKFSKTSMQDFFELNSTFSYDTVIGGLH